ncbi:FimV/HubP family polar landmark protein [Sediminicurvatus halobius]|uniref:FimV N-terminal domain-containing protein n=1 Tax=Sediminicurvatus halobius TaxID=2182432 RepID=A0A2U2MWH8_9GAMM|nr:FimV/HubP family polar landmark protein [Spiribacter halobius]PWG61162.1 hypothetical protein DEM34_17790 [Spiribacter halobius]UEX78982.1 hypothetical protein LMH63_04895 [Spiribacter halobius]
MTRKLLIASALAATGFASVAAALGLGSIDSQSTLNEPLRARIELLSADPDEIDRITAQLASPEAFERAGLERPFFLSRLDFDVVREGGSVFLEVTTNGAIKEPFLDFLVEVNWPNGRLLREYTLLLDPPTYTDDIAPNVAAGGSSEAGGSDAPEPAEIAQAAPAAAPGAAARGEAVADDDATGPAQYGPVQASDTLYSIAQQLRPDDLSINQTMLALLRANPDAFIDGNINALRRGAILRVPERPELTRLSVAEANAEVREQMARWQEQRSAPAADEGTEVAGADADAGADESAASETGDEATAVAEEPVEADTEAAAGGDLVAAADAGAGDGELRLVAPDESEGVDATTSLAEADLEATPESVSRLQAQLALLEESNTDLRAENDDLRSQVQGLRSELDELQRMINLRLAQDLPLDSGGEGDAGSAGARDPGAGEAAEGVETAAAGDDGLDAPVAAGGDEAAGDEPAAAGDTGEAAGETAARTAAAAADEASAASEPEAAETAQAPEEQPAATISFLEMMLADTRLMTYAGGGVAALLLLLLLVQRRRRAAAADAADEGLPAPAVAPVAAAGGAAAGVAGGDSAGISAEAGDPLEEAELYMAYGRADQAQEVLDRALGEEPDNIELRTRLLEILAERGDRGGFEAEAQVLHTQLASEDDPRWQRIVALGRSAAPEHPLFATPDAAAESAVTGSAEHAAGVEPAAAADAGTLDDLTESAADTVDGDDDFGLAADEAATEYDGAEDDWDAPAASRADADSPASTPEASGAEEGVSAAAPDRSADDEFGDLEFDLGDFSFGEDEDTPAGRRQADADDDGGLDFSLDDTEEEFASGDEPAEFRLDEALESADGGVSGRPGDAGRPASDGDDDGELDFGDFSLDEPARGAGSGDADDSGDIDGLDEVGTKLDLARAYMDMGDAEGARSLLDEVAEEGNEAQKREAEELLQRTG